MGTRRVYSAFKFLYTLLGLVLMLVAIFIYWISGTTDVVQLYEPE